MFATKEHVSSTDWDSSWKVDAWEAELLATEEEISRLRSKQIGLLRRLDGLQVDLGDGDRTMGDWVAARLDVSHQVARRMMRVATANNPDIEEAMASGEYGIDRASVLCRLRALEGPEDVIRDSSSYSLGHLYGLVDRLRRIDPATEAFRYVDRYLVIQPSLDQSSTRFWGETSGVDGQIIEKAITRREQRFPALPDQSQGQRRLDALTAICMDSITGSGDSQDARAVTVAEIFVDATMAADSFGEAGAVLSSGPRVGPNTLSDILCEGKVRVIFQGSDGRPIGVSDLGESIPPAVRSFVLHRDQGRCVIDGCSSRYRLQLHHLRPRSQGGDHDPDSLATVCWYHHHVAIHMLGMVIDLQSPPHRRRLKGWRNHGPPSVILG